MEERFKSAITVSAIILNEDNNEVLLQKRCNTGYMDGMYAIVAGHLEDNESLLSGVIREVKEEINLDLLEEDVSFVCIIRSGNNPSYINSYFKCSKYNGIVKNKEVDKCSSLKWFNINNLPDNIIPNDKRAIKNMINNKVLDEYDF